MASVDEAVGRVKEAMEERGRWDESVAVFFNDNGGNVWEGGRNFPFRGGKMSSFEGGVRATGLIKFPKSEEGRIPPVFTGLAHVSDVMPTVLGYVDSLFTSPPSPSFPPGDAELGRGYDLSSMLLGIDDKSPKREDVLMQYEPSTDRLGYRWNDWKLVSGQIGDPRRFLEPRTDQEWIGDTFHDRVAELIMHWQHGWDEDASGTMDETVREIAVTVQEYWRILIGVVKGGWRGKEKGRALLYNLSLDPYEDKDVAADHPEVVEDMVQRVSEMEKHFPKNCDWFVMDRNIEFEQVSWVDGEGERRVDDYHSPFVKENDIEGYEPLLLNVNPARKYASAAIVAVEFVFMLWLVVKVMVAMGKGLGLGGENKKKLD